MLFQSPDLKLFPDRLEDAHGTLYLDELPDREPTHPARLIAEAPAIVEKLWRAALYDAESNLCVTDTGRYFTAGGRGKGWMGMSFTRDQGFAGILGLDRLFPEAMWDALRLTVEQRLAVGMKIDREEYHPSLPFEDTGLSYQAFKQTYGTNSFARRTDDVLWLWWAADLLSQPGLDTDANWSWVYETGRRCFAELYAPFFDDTAGLYRGQSSFFDIGHNGYPDRFGPLHSLEAKVNCLNSFAASTNCLFYKGLSVMADAARRAGRAEDSAAWSGRAESLRDAIHRQFLRPDGTLAYLIDPEGQREDRQHALATAFAVLLGVVDGEAAQQAIAHYPVHWWGVPMLHPFYDNDACYHNKSAWAFTDGFFLRAREIALGTDEAWRGIALAARSCRGDTFHEWFPATTKQAQGQPAQLWTIGAYVGHCYAAGLVAGAAEGQAIPTSSGEV